MSREGRRLRPLAEPMQMLCESGHDMIPVRNQPQCKCKCETQRSRYKCSLFASTTKRDPTCNLGLTKQDEMGIRFCISRQRETQEQEL